MEIFLITTIKLITLSILAMIVYFSFLKIKNPPKNVSRAGFSILILFMITLYVLYLLQMKYNYIHSFVAIFIIFCLICLLILKLNNLYTRSYWIDVYFYNNHSCIFWI